MNKDQLDEKISSLFSELVIDKALVRTLKIREKRTIPTFVEEWLISRYQVPGKSNADVYSEITDFMSKHLPAKTERKNKIPVTAE